MIVVDANVIVYLSVQMAETRMAEALARHDRQWRVPPLWRFEVTSAVTTLVNARRLTPAEGEVALVTAGDLMNANEEQVDQIQVLAAAVRFKISAYDAQYVALAMDMKIPCVTADRPLLRKTAGITVPLAGFEKYV